jgi:hypothetical protein
MSETPFARAWREFQDSHADCFNGDTLRIPLNQQKYLYNRLMCAFTAGWNASHAPARPTDEEAQ